MITVLPERIDTVEQAKHLLDLLYINGETKLLWTNTDGSYRQLDFLFDQMEALPDFDPITYVKDYHGIDRFEAPAAETGSPSVFNSADPGDISEEELQRIRMAVHNYTPRVVSADPQTPVVPVSALQEQLELKKLYHSSLSDTYLRLFNDVKKDFELISKDPFTVMHFQPQRPDEFAIFRDMLQKLCEYHRYQSEQANGQLTALTLYKNDSEGKDAQ